MTSINGAGVSESYSYNGVGTRVARTAGSSTTNFLRDGVGVTAPVVRDTGAAYTPGISERRSGVTTYHHHGLKSIENQSNVAQTMTGSRNYDAFGNVISSSGSWQGAFGYAGGFGYQEDASGFKLLGHRYYDSSTGRFLTRDPIKDGRNWYGYGAGEANPVTGVDPDGKRVRPLTEDERTTVSVRIDEIAAYDPVYAGELRRLLESGMIMVDTTMDKDKFGYVPLGGTNKGKIIIMLWVIKDQISLIATLVHELIHVRQMKSGKKRDQRRWELEATQKTIEFLRKMRDRERRRNGKSVLWRRIVDELRTEFKYQDTFDLTPSFLPKPTRGQ